MFPNALTHHHIQQKQKLGTRIASPNANVFMYASQHLSRENQFNVA